MVEFHREWAMPSADTFNIPPIGLFVKKYLHDAKVSIDPFARNKKWCTYTNDLNPDTTADYHEEANVFMDELKDRGVLADLIIFDPPYSTRQVSECYQKVGIKATQNDTSAATWSNWKKSIKTILSPGGIVLSFGWNSTGMGFPFEILEILLVCHGGYHNDTICVADKYINIQETMGDF